MATKPDALVDSVPGNIGLLGPARMLWSFAEPDGVMPSDAIGNLDDLGVAVAAPIAAIAWTGGGRTFTRSLSHGLVAADLPGKDTLLQRDVTVQALVSLTLTGASAGPQTLIARGLNDGSIAERYAFGIELQASGTAGHVDVRMFWQDGAGVIRTQTAGLYQHPGDGVEFLLTVTRRWESTSKVVVRYYANEYLLGEIISVDGDISGGTTGGTSIGTRKAVGVWSNFFNGTIDNLAVFDREVSLEEIRETWRRLHVHQPAGVAMFTGLILPGLRWAADPGNYSGRRVKLAGQALGLGIAAIEELRALFLPDASPKDLIARWERLTGLSAKPRDSLDRRRSRVTSFLAREEGMSGPAVLATLDEPLDAATSPLALVEFTNTVTDDFTTLRTERWLIEPAASWSIVASALRVTVAGGADVRWETQRLGRHARMALNREGGRFFVSAKLVSSTLQADAGVGLLLNNGRSGNAIWFGVYNNAGTVQLGYRKVAGNVLGAWTPIVTPWASSPVWLRIYTPQGTGFSAGSGSYTFGYSTTGPTTGFVEQVIATGVTDPEWAGFGVFGTSAALVGAVTADFDDFTAYMPDGLRTFNWYVYRNPALGGDPDIVGGRLLVEKIKPAHTHATAIESMSVLCDNARYGLCDRGPMGGL